MKVYTDRHKSPCAKVPVKTLDDWGNLESAFSVAAGVQPLYFVYEGSGSVDFAEFEISR